MSAGRASARVGLAAALLLTVAARVGYLLYPKVNFNADEATTGLMVRKFLDGHLSTFYAGQNYGGTLEQLLQAAMYEILRLPQDRFTLRLTQVALSVATAALVYLCGQRMLPTRGHALLATTLFAVAPWFNVVATATSQGFYVVSQTLVMLAIYAALRAAADPRWSLLVGLVAGLGVWTTVTTLYVLIPLAAWLVPIVGRRIGIWLGTVGALLVGAAPALVWAIRHGALPLPHGGTPPSTPLHRLANLLGPVLREFLGLRYQNDARGVPTVLAELVVVVALAGYGLALWRRRAALLATLRLRTADRRPLDLLLLVPPVVLVLFVVSPNGWYTDTPRYLITVFPLLAIALAAAVPAGVAFRPVAAAALVVAVVLSAGFFVTATMEPRIPRRERAMRALTAMLQRDGETRVYAEYWTATPLQYLVGDRLVVGTCIGTVRFPDQQRRVDAVAAPVYVTNTSNSSDAILRAALARLHVTFRERRVDYLRVYDELSSPVRPDQIG